MREKRFDVSAILQKKGVLIVLLAAGLLLLLWPRQSGGTKQEGKSDVSTTEEKRLSAVLSQIDGVGEVYALLSEEANHRGVFSGAVIVCEGARSADVRLRVVNAVSAFTGLGSSRIIVEELKSQEGEI